MANEFWLSDTQWASIERHLPCNQPGAHRADGRICAALGRSVPLSPGKRRPIALALHLTELRNTHLDFEWHLVPALHRAREQRRVPQDLGDLDWHWVIEEAEAIAGSGEAEAMGRA